MSVLRRASLPRASLEQVLGSTRYRTPYAIESLSVSSNGRWILAGLSGKDSRKWLFDANTGAVRRRIDASQVVLHENGRDYLAQQGSKLVRVEIETGAVLAEIALSGNSWGASIDPWGAGIVQSDRGLVRWDATTVPLPLLGPEMRGALMRGGLEFVCSTAEGTFRRFSLVDGSSTPLDRVAPAELYNYLIAISPDERTIAIRTNVSLYLIDAETGRTRSIPRFAIDQDGRWSNPLAIDDRRCALGSRDGIEVIDLRSRRRISMIRTPKPVTQLAFSRAGDGRLWCSRNDDLRYSPDGDCLLAWDVEKRVRVIPADRGHVDRVDGVAYARLDGREQVFTAGCDGAVKRWFLGESQPRAVNCVTLVPTEKLELSVEGRVLCVSESEYNGAGGFAQFGTVDREFSVRNLRAESYRARAQGIASFETGLCARLRADGQVIARMVRAYVDSSALFLLRVEGVRSASKNRVLTAQPQPTDGGFVALEWLDRARLMLFMEKAALVINVDEDKVEQRYAHEPWSQGTTAAALNERECISYRWGGYLSRLNLETNAVVARPEAPVLYVYPLVWPTLELSRDRSLALVNSYSGAQVFRTDTLALVASLRFAKNAGPLCAASFSDDNERVIVGCKRGVALVYRLDRSGR